MKKSAVLTAKPKMMFAGGSIECDNGNGGEEYV
jgi:hypothetical protein